MPELPAAHQPQYAPAVASWRALVWVFFKLGVVAFGGPVAHIALMEKEVVQRREWVQRPHFMDLVAATNLIPGPNSTQMTMHIGYVQRGNGGVWAAGTAFVLPATAITLGVTWAYVTYRELPAVDAAFYAVGPVVLAIIATAIVRLARTAADDWRTRGIFAGALVLALFGLNELIVLALGALAGVLAYRQWRRIRGLGTPLLALLAAPWLLGAQGGPGIEGIGQLAWLFFKFGITLFGSGYLLFAYLQADVVDRLGLLSTDQLLEAIVIGEMTPGPLFTVATVVGYIVAGLPGALVATAAIFLPSFGFAMALGRLMPAIKRSEVARRILRGLTAAVLGVMLAVAITVGLRVITDVPTVIFAVAALAALLLTRVSGIALIPIAGAAGYLWVTFFG